MAVEEAEVAAEVAEAAEAEEAEAGAAWGESQWLAVGGAPAMQPAERTKWDLNGQHR